MKPNTERPNAPESKPGSKLDAKTDAKAAAKSEANTKTPTDGVTRNPIDKDADTNERRRLLYE
jgi:hypothetical protein